MLQRGQREQRQRKLRLGALPGHCWQWKPSRISQISRCLVALGAAWAHGNTGKSRGEKKRGGSSSRKINMATWEQDGQHTDQALGLMEQWLSGSKGFQPQPFPVLHHPFCYTHHLSGWKTHPWKDHIQAFNSIKQHTREKSFWPNILRTTDQQTVFPSSLNCKSPYACWRQQWHVWVPPSLSKREEDKFSPGFALTSSRCNFSKFVYKVSTKNYWHQKSKSCPNTLFQGAQNKTGDNAWSKSKPSVQQSWKYTNKQQLNQSCN